MSQKKVRQIFGVSNTGIKLLSMLIDDMCLLNMVPFLPELHSVCTREAGGLRMPSKSASDVEPAASVWLVKILFLLRFLLSRPTLGTILLGLQSVAIDCHRNLALWLPGDVKFLVIPVVSLWSILLHWHVKISLGGFVVGGITEIIPEMRRCSLLWL